MEPTYFTQRGYHYSVCQLCGKREREGIPDQAPDEYRHNPGNLVLALCPNCNHGVGTARIVLDNSKLSHKAQYSAERTMDKPCPMIGYQSPGVDGQNLPRTLSGNWTTSGTETT